MTVKNEGAEIVRATLFSVQVCVPSTWTDDQITDFAEMENPCGTEHGWKIRKSGEDERVQCSQRPEFTHVLLDA